MAGRKRFTAEIKAKVVPELISGEKGLMQASREYAIKDSVFSRWKQQFHERSAEIFEQPRQTCPEEERIALLFFLAMSFLLVL